MGKVSEKLIDDITLKVLFFLESEIWVASSLAKPSRVMRGSQTKPAPSSWRPVGRMGRSGLSNSSDAFCKNISKDASSWGELKLGLTVNRCVVDQWVTVLFLEQSVNVWEGMGSTCNQKQNPESVEVHIISNSLDELQHYHMDLRNTYIFALFAVKCLSAYKNSSSLWIPTMIWRSSGQIHNIL